MKTHYPLQVLRGLLLTLVAVSLGAWAYRTSTSREPESSQVLAGAPPGLPTDGLVVVNFHGATRCRSCRVIGEQSRLTVESGRREGWLPQSAEWRALDFDEPSNQHFINRYQLVSSAVVVLRREGGRDIEWKRLDEVWDHAFNPAAMSDYLRREFTRVAGAARP